MQGRFQESRGLLGLLPFYKYKNGKIFWWAHWIPSDIPIFNLTMLNGKYFECEVFWHATQMVLNDTTMTAIFIQW